MSRSARRGFLLLLCVIISAVAAQTTDGTRQRNNSITDICNASSRSLDEETVNLTESETVSINGNCRVANVVHLTIQGSSELRPTIQCLRKQGTVSSTAFTFNNVSSLKIANVNFVGCGGILTKEDISNSSNSSVFFFGEGQAAVIFCSLCVNLSLVNVSFSDNTGYAFAGVNVLGDSILNGVHVYGKDDHHNDTILLCTQPEYKHTCRYQGVLLLFVDSGEKTDNSTTVQISNSVFDYNYDAPIKKSETFTNVTCVKDIFDELISPFYFSNPMPDVGALTIIQSQTFFKALVKVLNSNFTNNGGMCFGAVFIMFSIPSSSLGEQIFQNCHFSNNSPIFSPKHFGGSYIGNDITIYMQFYENYDSNKCISLIHSSFSMNEFPNTLRSTSITVTHFPITRGKCTLYLEDVWTNATTKLLYVSGLYQEDSLDVVMKDIRMLGKNTLGYNLNSIGSNYGLLTFVNVQNVTLHGTSQENCQFNNLIGPIIVTQSSNLFLTGEMLFANTFASKWATGAAIMLQADSALWFQEPLYAIFSNNTALNGGAIGSVQLVTEFCVLQYYTSEVYHDDNVSSMNVTIEFSNNSAHIAGNSIYIESLYFCSMRIAPRIRVSNTSVIYDSSFKFENKVNNGLMEMSSTPYKVCVCTGDATDTSKAALNCGTDTSNMTRILAFPGQTFSIYVIVVDEAYNAVFSTVYNTLGRKRNSVYRDKSDWYLGYGQNVVLVYGYNCSLLNFTIFTLNDEESDGILALYPYSRPESIDIPITLKECPLGFELSSGLCNCTTLLVKQDFLCSINDETLTKHKPTSWVGVVTDDSKVFLAYASHCSFQYCEPQQVIKYNNFESVCKFNRSGILCGQCSKNFSNVFGSPTCRECSSLWLLTIPLYFLVGLLLVVFLFSFRLTVTTGTINGVIFYANILNINVFFLSSYRSFNWLRVFISLLNLELGFPICFYNGMSAIEAAYLSFTVPIYLWLTLLVIIFLSRHFQFVSNITSRSAVPVMATLIHLSFSKVLHLVVDCLLYMKLELEVKHDDGNITYESRTVWYFDGNVDYFSTKHSFLFFMAIFFLLFFLIPYTVFLTGIKFFLRYRLTNRNRIRPFVDAFCAPYKDKYRFWFGTRLWLLICSYIAYAALCSQPYLLVLFQTIFLICFTLIQAAIMPYKNAILNYLELFFLGNSMILYTVGLYSTDTDGIEVLASIQISVNVIVATAFLIFLAIIGYHVYIVLGVKLIACFSQTKKKVVLGESEFSNTPSEGNDSEKGKTGETSYLNDDVVPTALVTYSSLAIQNHGINVYRPGELREPLLECDSDNN